MNKKDLVNQIRRKKTFLCIGLDTDLNKIPKHLSDYDDPVFEFNKQIIDSTQDLCVAYKLNTAFVYNNFIILFLKRLYQIKQLTTNIWSDGVMVT